MNTKRLILSAVLLDYLAFTAWALYAAGWAGVVDTVASPIGLQMTAELLLFFGVAATYVYRDAQARGLKAGRWAASVMCTGIVGVLIYLIQRSKSPAPARGALQPAVS